MSSDRVLVVGDVMTDVIVVPEGPLLRGSDRRATIRSRPGGSGANQAVWLGAMGTRVSFAARVGAADKPQLEAYFRSFHVDPVLTADPQLASGMLVTIVDADGERSFLTDRGANLALERSDMPVWLLEDTRLLLVSGYSFFAAGPRSAVQWITGEAGARGIGVAIDPASVGFLREVGPRNFLDWTAGAATIFANAEEAAELTGCTDLEEQMVALGAHYGRVVIKRGSAGAALGDRSGIHISLPAQVTEVVDSTGAGDAFAAGFLTAEFGGGSPEECLRAGIEAGGRAVATIGGQPERNTLTL